MIGIGFGLIPLIEGQPIPTGMPNLQLTREEFVPKVIAAFETMGLKDAEKYVKDFINSQDPNFRPSVDEDEVEDDDEDEDEDDEDEDDDGYNRCDDCDVTDCDQRK